MNAPKELINEFHTYLAEYIVITKNDWLNDDKKISVQELSLIIKEFMYRRELYVC